MNYFSPNITTYSDYYPFGMLMPGRNGGEYRYGMNGMEQDDEVSGKGNSLTTPFRMYNPRLGRWMSTDPITHPQFSPYSAFDNNPIYYADPSGADSEDGGGDTDPPKEGDNKTVSTSSEYQNVNFGYTYENGEWVEQGGTGTLAEVEIVAERTNYNTISKGSPIAKHWGGFSRGWNSGNSGSSEYMTFFSIPLAAALLAPLVAEAAAVSYVGLGEAGVALYPYTSAYIIKPVIAYGATEVVLGERLWSTGSNFASQFVGNGGNLGKIDVFGLGTSFVTGNPVIGGGFDAFVDVNFKGQYYTPFTSGDHNKSLKKTMLDFTFGMVGGHYHSKLNNGLKSSPILNNGLFLPMVDFSTGVMFNLYGDSAKKGIEDGTK